MTQFSCGESIYNPDTSNREIVNCNISLTPLAIKTLKEIQNEEVDDLYLYLMIHGGGCSGYIYDLQLLEDKPNSLYQIIIQDDIKIAIHELDSGLLDGLIIDYVDKLMGGGFKMINPNANGECGCGLSFN